VYQLGLLILFSFLFSGSVFLVLQDISIQQIEAHHNSPDFLDDLLEDEVAKIQHYITFNGITTQQFYKIDQWIDRDVVTSLSLFYKDRLVYSSDVSYQEKILENGIKRKPLPWEKVYPIQFKDKELQLSLSVELKDHENNRALLRNLFIATILFISCVLFFVHRKTSEISKLEQQIQMMQGGSLDMPIEVKGNDEIASLAESLEEMRYAFVQQMEYEKVQESTGKLFASSISHDIRTPLAALIGYLDILVHNRTSDEKKRKEYLIYMMFFYYD
jgi:signal transduction histidine kinase